MKNPTMKLCLLSIALALSACGGGSEGGGVDIDLNLDVLTWINPPSDLTVIPTDVDEGRITWVSHSDAAVKFCVEISRNEFIHAIYLPRYRPEVCYAVKNGGLVSLRERNDSPPTDSAGQTFWYRVRACTKTLCSAYSRVFVGKMPHPRLMAPSSPSINKAQIEYGFHSGRRMVEFRWTDNSYGEGGHEVVIKDGNIERTYQMTGNHESVWTASYLPGTTLTFKVRAFDDKWPRTYSEFSEEKTFTTSP